MAESNVSSVKGSAFSFGKNQLFNFAPDFGARTFKTAAQNTTIITGALSDIAAAGGGVLVIPQGIQHSFDPLTQFPATANYLTVLEWTGGTYKAWCNQTLAAEFGGDVRVDGALHVVGAAKLYGQVALSKLMIVPATGESIQIPSGVQKLILRPAATLAALTVVTPQAPEDGAVITVYSSQVLTAFTVSPYAGQTVVGAPTTLGAQSSVEFIFNKTASTGFTADTWYRSR